MSPEQATGDSWTAERSVRAGLRGLRDAGGRAPIPRLVRAIDHGPARGGSRAEPSDSAGGDPGGGGTRHHPCPCQVAGRPVCHHGRVCPCPDPSGHRSDGQGHPRVTSASHERRHRRWARIGSTLVAGLVAIGLITSVRAVSSNKGAELPAAELSIRSLAVAPLENLTGDSTQTYLAQGVTDQLIANLTQIASLAVIKLPPRRGDRAPVDVARERGVDIDAVLAGSFQRAGDEVRITAQITLAGTERAIWARSYTGQLRDMLNLQDSVVRAVADTIRVSLTPRDSSRLSAAKKQIDPAAYEAYVRGASYTAGRTGRTFERRSATSGRRSGSSLPMRSPTPAYPRATPNSATLPSRARGDLPEGALGSRRLSSSILPSGRPTRTSGESTRSTPGTSPRRIGTSAAPSSSTPKPPLPTSCMRPTCRR